VGALEDLVDAVRMLVVTPSAYALALTGRACSGRCQRQNNYQFARGPFVLSVEKDASPAS
jgi:hypothetical protein